METETETVTPATVAPWVNPDRFKSWCDTCRDHTESDDGTGKWCVVCGDRRE